MRAPHHVALASFLLCVAPPVLAGVTLVSLGPGNVQANSGNSLPDASINGQYVVFASWATNLVGGDTNASIDIFVRDTVAGTTARMSVSTAGAQGNDHSYDPAISASGRFVILDSPSNNLVAGDNNAAVDVFLHDRTGGTTALLSVATGGQQGNGISYAGDISGDGNFVVFSSAATNLVAGDTNGTPDIFLRDVRKRVTTRVSVTSNGTQANGESLDPRLSGDGRWVVFASRATNLVANDTNNAPDVFLRDLQTNTTTRISVASNGAQADGASGDAAVNNNGTRIAFASIATNLVAGDTNAARDVFVRDTAAGTTTRVSLGPAGVQANAGSSSELDISNNGRWVVFDSDATNLVAGDTNGLEDVFVHDRQTNTVKRVSLTSTGAEPNDFCHRPAISGDGTSVVYQSPASNLVPNDTNKRQDIFAASNPFLGGLAPDEDEPRGLAAWLRATGHGLRWWTWLAGRSETDNLR